MKPGGSVDGTQLMLIPVEDEWKRHLLFRLRFRWVG